jgi:hypothetical protein
MDSLQDGSSCGGRKRFKTIIENEDGRLLKRIKFDDEDDNEEKDSAVAKSGLNNS